MRLGRLAVAWLVVGAAAVPAAAEPVTRAGHAGPRYRVRIESDPPGATVYLDGKQNGEVGTTPINLEMQAGSWQLRLELAGHAALDVELVVARKRPLQRQRYQLEESATGTLSVGAAGDESRGGTILVNGEEAGTVPQDLEVEEGPHELEVSKEGYGGFDEWVQVIAGETTTVLIDLQPKGRRKPRRPPPPEEVVEEPPPPTPAAPVVTAGPGYTASAGLALGGRSFSYVDPVTANLRPYEASGVALFWLAGEAYSPVGPRLVRDLGVSLRYERSLLLESATRDGDAITTVWSELEAAVRFRRRFGAGPRAPTAALSVGYSQVLFTFVDAGDLADEVPEVDYRFIRIAADGKLPRGKLTVFGGVGFRAVLDAGELADRFDAATAWGIDLALGVGYQLRPHIQVLATGSYARMSLSLAADPGDDYVASGAADGMYTLQVGAAYTF